jgi:cysteine sulfinate desulfinase/cysteine desulfurase-like protein
MDDPTLTRHQQLGTLERHGGVRFSIGAINTEAQVDAASHAMGEIARWAAAGGVQQGVMTTAL